MLSNVHNSNAISGLKPNLKISVSKFSGLNDDSDFDNSYNYYNLRFEYFYSLEYQIISERSYQTQEFRY